MIAHRPSQVVPPASSGERRSFRTDLAIALSILLLT